MRRCRIPAKQSKGKELNEHTDKVACETCHTGLRPTAALGKPAVERVQRRRQTG